MTSAFLPYGEDVEDICGKEELVSFCDVSSQYSANQSLTLKYQLGSRVQTTPSDWIGIFQDQWEDVTQPLARITLPNSERCQSKVRRKSVTFSAAATKSLGSKTKSYQFVYVNASQHVLGVSSPFMFEDDKKANLCRKEKDEEDNDSECSDSPVVLSSASEDEEDWDTSHHSNTLREACPGDATLLGDRGGSSASDLSDIVVLSTSPSQEAARLAQAQPDVTGEVRLAGFLGKIWSLGTNGSQGEETAGETGDQRGLQEDLDTMNTPRALNKKIVFRHSEKNSLGKNTTDSKKEEKVRDTDGITLEDISVSVDETAANLNILEGNELEGDSLLKHLRIVELDSFSGKEDNNEETQLLKPEKIDAETSKKNQSFKLITEITEKEAKSVKELSQVKDITKPSAFKNTKLENSEEGVNKPTSQKTGDAILNKKTLKKAKKKNRDKKSEPHKDDTEDDEMKGAELSCQKLLDALFVGAELSQCYEDEVLLSVPNCISKAPVKVKNKLAFDELLEVSVNKLKDQTNQAKQKVLPHSLWEATVIQTAGDEGELYSLSAKTDIQAGNKTNIYSADKCFNKTSSRPLKPKRAKKVKQSKPLLLAGEDKKENEPLKTGPDTGTLETFGDLGKVNQPNTEFVVEETNTFEETSDVSVNKGQGIANIGKSKRGTKTKFGKKAKQATCSKRKKASQLSCEFQYLFSVDVKRCQSDRENALTDLDASELVAKSSQNSDTTVPLILDTSDDGFPALPSQQENLKTQTCQEARLSDNEGVRSSREETEQKGVGKNDSEEDNLEKDYEEPQPHSNVRSRGEVLPYIPPYVLDVMDALPPASVSPDGRAMVEWKRSLMPLLPKHALPVFHNKYKAKYGRKLDLKRSKLRRAAASRNYGIIDRIRHQLAVPGTLDHVVKNWQRVQIPKETVSNIATGQNGGPPTDTEGDDTIPVPKPASPPSYASIVKKAIDTKDNSDESSEQAVSNSEQIKDTGEYGTKDVPHIVSESSSPLISQTISEPYQDAEQSVGAMVGGAMVGRVSNEKQGIGTCKISKSFPKEYTAYTSKEESKPNPSEQTISQKSCETAVNSSETPWFSPIFLTPSDSETGEKAFTYSEPQNKHSHTFEALGLHIRPTGKGHPKTLAGSPPRRPKELPQHGKKEKASAPCEPDQVTDTEGQKALLDMALSSCLADNAELRATVVSLEKQVRQFKLDQQRLAKSNQEEGNKFKEWETTLASKTKSFETSRLSRHRKVPVCKWAGKMARMVRSNVEVISLSTKVKGYEHEIASLTNQINALKEALQDETKRSRRALTKWFKAKLKVKVLRSRIRELQVLDSAPTACEASSCSPHCSAQESQHASSTPRPEETPEERIEDWEPPCKRLKLESSADEKQSKDQDDTAEIRKKNTPLLPAPQAESVLQFPIWPSQALPYSSPPIGPFFNFFSVNSGDNAKLSLDPALTQQHQQSIQQAVVAPLYNNGSRQVTDEKNSQSNLQLQQHLHPQHYFQHINGFPNGTNSVPQKPKTHTLLHTQLPDFQGHCSNDTCNTTRRVTCQRKKSPPHLPLPTPTLAPSSPPSCYHIPKQQANPWNNRAQHTSVGPSPVIPSAANQAHFFHPHGCHSSYLPSGWIIPPSNFQVVENRSDRGQNEPSFLSPWTSSLTLSPPWSACEQDRGTTQFAPLYTKPVNQNQAFISNVVRNQGDSLFKSSNIPENNVYPQKEIFHAPPNRPATFDSYYREEPSQAGPYRKPLSCVKAQNPPTVLGRQAEPPSPPGKYRSDFMRRLMKVEAAQGQKEPNPYRLFNRGTYSETCREQSHEQSPFGLYQTFPCVENFEGHGGFTPGTQSLASSTMLVTQPQLLAVNRPEASYRNTPAFVELTADGLVEATRIDIPNAPFFIDGCYNNRFINSSNNNLNHIIDYSNNNSTKFRPIESQSAFDFFKC